MDVIVKAIIEPESLRSQCLIVPIFTDGKLSKAARRLNKASGGTIQAMVKRGDITGKLAETLLLPAITGIKAERILLLGCGEGKKLSTADFGKLMKAGLDTASNSKLKDACLLIDELSVHNRNAAWLAGQVAITGGSDNYRYSKTVSKPKPAATLKRVTVSGKPNQQSKISTNQGKAIATGMNVAKELGNLPANICTPSYLAKQAKALGRKHKNLSVSIIEEKKMRELGMGSLLSVTAGTDQPAKLIVMEYQGAAKNQKPTP